MDAGRRRSRPKRGEHDDPTPSGIANAAGSLRKEMAASFIY
jgi:hypothetical protein